MSWYSTGTVQVTNGSTAVVGTGTGWFGALQFGWGFVGPDGRNYEITAVASDTALTLATPYQGATAAAQSYSAFPTAGTEVGLTQAIQALIAGFQAVKDGPGQGKFTGNVVLASDPDTGLTWPSSNEIGLLAGNAVQLAMKAGQATGAAVQSSPTDSTTGKLLKVGAGGLLSTDLATCSDANALRGTGKQTVKCYGAANMPPGSTDVFVVQHIDRSNGAATQMAINLTDNTIYLRSYASGAWSAWDRILTSVGDQTIDGDLSLTGYISDKVIASNGEGLNLQRADGNPYAVRFNCINGQSFYYCADSGHQFKNLAETETYAVINSSGVGIGTNGPSSKLHVSEGGATPAVTRTQASHAAYTGAIEFLYAYRAASSAYSFLHARSGGSGGDLEFRLSGDGNATCDGSWSGGGADYAEYFEWQDGNPAGEDRRGVAVVLEGDQIRPAVAGEHPIGVISATPSVIGDGDMDRWKGKYLRDAFGAYLTEDYEVVEWTERQKFFSGTDFELKGDGYFTDPLHENPPVEWRDVPHSYAVDAVPEGLSVPPEATRSTQQRRVLNPAYDPDQPYLPRSERPEWALVGLLGKLRIRSGQPTAPGWIKMRDVSAEVAEWLVK